MIRNQDVLWGLYNDRSYDLSVSFIIRPDAVTTMDISGSKMVYEEIKEKVEGEKKNEN